MTTQNTAIQNYKELLLGFQKANYDFCRFEDKYPSHCIVLRHDVDIDPLLALRMAIVENELGISGTYFFNLRSSLYNLFDENCIQIVKEIHQLNHDIGAHIEFHKEIASVLFDLRVISELFPFSRTDIASIHRPGNLAEINLNLECFRKVYQPIINGEIDYISDSAGIWKYGHPFQRESFLKNKPIQLLIHPVWWVEAGRTAYEKISNWEVSHFTYTKKAVRATLPNVKDIS